MSRYFQDLDRPHFDYHLEEYEHLPGWELRGPLPDLSRPYFVCVGAAQMFGRFCHEPLPQILSKEIGLPVVNLGLAGSGPRLFLGENFLSLINRAQFAVVQVMSGRSESNSEFDNGETGGARGLRIRDGKKMLFEEFLADMLAESSRASVTSIIEETRANWVGRYRELLTSITVPKVFHWFSIMAPRRTDDYAAWWKLLGPFPQLVNRRMIERIIPFADAYVQTVRNVGLPQPLWAADQPVDGTECYNRMLINNYYPSPEMHQAAMLDLRNVCNALAPQGSSMATVQQPSVRDIIVISANELDGMIITDLCGSRAVNITYQKLLEDRGLLPFLSARRPQVIHLRRRNLLDGFLSVLPPPANGSDVEQAIYVEPVAFASFVQATATAERRIARACVNSSLSEVFLEDFAADPKSVMTRIAEFTQQPGWPEADIFASVSRMTRPRTAQNTGELYALFNRVLRSVPKPGE